VTLTVSSTASRPWLFGEPDFCRLWLIGLVVFFSALARNAGGGGVRLSAHRLATHRRAADHAADAADGANRRLALMLLCSIVGTILAWSHALKVWHLALASFISGLTWTTDNPVRRTMIGEVVGPDRMSAAMSIDVGANNASRMLGPTVGGILLATLGIGGASR